jgi:hypothetical protein
MRLSSPMVVTAEARVPGVPLAGFEARRSTAVLTETSWPVARVRCRRALLAAAATGLVLVVVPGAAFARSNSVITLSVGDALSIAGSKIQCGVSKNVGYGLQLTGLTYIVCGPSTEVKGGGYVALMASNGRVVLLSVRTHKTVSSRTPASAVSLNASETAHIGDIVVLDGTSILCQVIKVSREPTLLCQYVDSRGNARPNSYSFGISDKLATSLAWNAKRIVRVLQAWPES